MKSSVSPRQVARAIGVSESTMKRWCDHGLIPVRKTRGGHRRMAVSDVIAFLRQSGHEVAQPELLGLPATVGRSQWTLDRARDQFFDSLVSGREDVAGEVVSGLLVGGHPIAAIFESVIGAALHQLGEKWSCGNLAIYQERRACEICLSVLHELRQRIPTHSSKMRPLAIGATLEHDHYSIPVAMVELILLEAGWNASSLGTNLPVETLVEAIGSMKPELFWISVSHVEDKDSLTSQLAELDDATASTGCRFVAGGQAIRAADVSTFPRIVHGLSLTQLAEMPGPLQAAGRDLEN